MDSMRRNLLLGAAGGASLSAVALAASTPTFAAATTVGPYSYIPPSSTAQADIQAALSAGAKAILLGAGTYSFSSTLVLPTGVSLSGVGQATQLVATASMARLIQIGNNSAVGGVQVSNLLINCASKANVGIEVYATLASGTSFPQGEPDAIIRFDDLWIYDALVDGVWTHGGNARALTMTRVRVRRAVRHGFFIEGTDSWLIACEATTSAGTGAGFNITGTNNNLDHCKAWYCRGNGFTISAVRTILTGCLAQDCVMHGFYIQNGKCTLQACMADSCSSTAAGGTAGQYDGFYVLWDTSLTMGGCVSYNRNPSAKVQRWGYNVPAAMVSEGRLAGCIGYDNINGTTTTR